MIMMIQRNILVILSLIIGLTMILAPSTAYAAPGQCPAPAATQPTSTPLFPEPKGIPKSSADCNKIQTIVNVAFSIFGAVALLIITIAGFRFVIHQGEPAEMTKQRNSIIYAVIGLIVMLSAWTIVSFVIGKL